MKNVIELLKTTMLNSSEEIITLLTENKNEHDILIMLKKIVQREMYDAVTNRMIMEMH